MYEPALVTASVCQFGTVGITAPTLCFIGGYRSAA